MIVAWVLTWLYLSIFPFGYGCGEKGMVCPRLNDPNTIYLNLDARLCTEVEHVGDGDD